MLGQLIVTNCVIVEVLFTTPFTIPQRSTMISRYYIPYIEHYASQFSEMQLIYMDKLMHYTVSVLTFLSTFSDVENHSTNNASIS